MSGTGAIASTMRSLSMEASSEDIDALNLWLAFCLAEEQFQEAAIALQQLIELEPDVPDHYNNLGTIWLQVGDDNAAIDCFQSALQLDPLNTDFLNDLLPKLTVNKQWDQVIAICIHALQVHPIWDQGFLYLGNALQQQGALEWAQSCSLGLVPEALVQQIFPNSFIGSAASLDDVIYQVVEPAHFITLPSIQKFNEIVHLDLATQELEIPAAHVTQVHQARVWSDPYTRAVLTAEDVLLKEASMGSGALIAASNALPIPTRFQGSLCCLTIRFSHNYFHWMYDLLPKLELLERANISIDRVDAFLVNSCSYPFQRETLNLLGIPDEKILDRTLYHAIADHLIVPVSPFDGKGKIAKSACDFLRRHLLPHGTSTRRFPKRFYISRKGASYRRVQNEEEVMANLQSFGFEEVALETFSVQEQITLFSQAEVIVAPHGAGLTNLVFSQPGVTLIEILSANEFLNYYRVLSHYLDINYYYFIADASEPYLHTANPGKALSKTISLTDMVIQPELLLAALKLAQID